MTYWPSAPYLSTIMTKKKVKEMHLSDSFTENVKNVTEHRGK